MLTGAATVLAFASFGATAQQTASTDTEVSQLEEVVVTGSHLLRTDTETPSPVQVVTAEEMHESGYTSTQQVLNALTANGQGTLSQAFPGAFASGGAGIALRGLNVEDTLVLIDGHRTAAYPIGDDGYRSFVDVSNLPFDAIERVEILKDGASAVYGSDAIAGVINVILKKSYEGASVTADGGLSSHGDGTQYHFSGIWGIGDLQADGHNVYLSAEYREQKPIYFTQRGGTFENRDYSSQGGIDATYGASNELNGGLPGSATGYITDPSGAIAGYMPGCNATTFAANQCTFKDTWDQIQPPTTNINVTARATQNFSSDWKGSFEASYFESKDEQVNRPDGPNQTANGYQGIAFGPGIGPSLLPTVGPITIPSTNPSFPTGANLLEPGLTSGLLRYTFLNLGGVTTETDSKTYRAGFDVDGKVAGWDLDFAVGFSEVSLALTGLNYVDDTNLQIALDSTTAPFLVGQPNTTAVNNFVAPPLTATDISELAFGHLGVTRDLVQLPGGPLGFAFGSDFYWRNQDAVAPLPVQNGTEAVGDFSNNFTIGEQQVASGYLEADAPIFKQLDVDGALRYDHYNLSGGKASPKIGIKFTPIPQFAVRGTWSQGFRAPGPGENGRAGQSFFAGTTNDPVLCPNPGTPSAAGNFAGQCVLSIPGLQASNPNLKPETSNEFTVGFIVQPIKDISATIDYYSIQINNQIVPGSSAGVGATALVRGTNFSPLPEYQENGSTVLTVPPVAQIAYLGETYINANSTKTDGFDLGVEAKHQFDFGTISSKVTWTYVAEWNLTIAGTTYDLAGTHGPTFYSGDTGNPRSRVQWATTFAQPSWEVTGTMNYIDSYKDIDPSIQGFGYPPQNTCLEALTNGGGFAGIVYANELGAGTVPPNVGCTTGHFIDFDLYGRYNATRHLNFHGSVTNLFNAKAPLDWVTYGGAGGNVPWNPSMHQAGAIGTFFTLGATYTF